MSRASEAAESESKDQTTDIPAAAKNASTRSKATDTERHYHKSHCRGQVPTVNTDYFHVPDHWRTSQSIQLSQGGDILDDLDRFGNEGGAAPPETNNNYHITDDRDNL